jgi:xanthine dehydrogenase accessory factor
METRGLAERICTLLANDQPVAVATILSREGSAPRTAGSKMVIEHGGAFTGTIGGGKFEADVLTAANEALAKRRPQKLFFDLTSDDAAGMDMICGGAMSVLVDVLTPASDELSVFEAWKRTQENSTAAALVTVITSDAAGATQTDRCIVYADGHTIGSWRLPRSLLTQMVKIAGKGGVPRLIEADDDQVLVEPTTPPVTLLVFGAGHVSMPTARMAVDVGFRVIVADDRSAFANRERFAAVDEVVVIDEFTSAMSRFATDENTYVVIVTRGHRYDKTVLAQSLRTKAGYIGMIGSRRKRDTIYAALKQEGVSDEDIARVHCPIGLTIGAETPEEIAVSIVAELIAHRSGVSV